jgi:ADP-heptose:LPS heptosyltransferase
MTPCLAALKSWRPEIKIAVLIEPLCAPLLEDHPLVDELIVVNPSLSSRAGLVARLRKQRFDIAFNMHGGTTGTLMARLSGARRTFAYRGHRQSWMLSDRAPSPDKILGRPRIHSVEQQLALLHWAGVPGGERPRLSLFVSQEVEASVRDRLVQSVGLDSRKGFAVIAPSAAFDSKRWPADGFAAVADHLNLQWNLESVVIAGPGHEHIAREVSHRARCKPPIISDINLKELMALIRLSALFVGNDSGPAHIAASFARPLVVVFGSSDPSVWHPWTDSPCRVVAKSDRENIAMIPDREVIEAVDEVLSLAASQVAAKES